MAATNLKRSEKITTAKTRKIIASVQDLQLHFYDKVTKKQKVVIRNTGFDLYEGEILAIIGESGSGKTVITSALSGLLPKTARITNGKILVDGTNVETFKDRQWFKSGLRGKTISVVFQDPMTTLNPTMKIGKQIAEGLLVNKRATSKSKAYAIAVKMLRKMRITNPAAIMNTYPHQLSGGMKQRCVLAAAFCCQPKILILDEPTTALDPSVQAEILDIIHNLKKEFEVSIIFITHDLGVVSAISDRIAIMYAGKVIEIGNTKEIMWHPQHPYTWGLISSMPDVNFGERLETIPGAVPNDLGSIKGDAFAPRNTFALDIDKEEHPPFFKISPTHYAATWLLDKRSPKYKPPATIAKRWEHFTEMRGKR